MALFLTFKRTESKIIPMKNIKKGILLGFTLFAFQAFAQKPIFITAKTNSALVYLKGAELAHTTTVNLQKGTNEVVVKNVANQLDNGSIRISSNKNVAILSATFSTQYYTDYEIDPNSVAVKQVKDSITLMEKKISLTQNKLDAEKETIKMIDKNQVVTGSNTGLNVAELSKAIDYYRQKRAEFANNVFDYEKEQVKNRETLARLKNQLTVNENQEEKISNGKIVLQIMSDVAQIAQLNISYITPLASWSPFYEIASNGIESDVHITSKAKIYQTTGIDWKAIGLTLSSSQPNPNNTIPELSRWFLDLERPMPSPTLRSSRNDDVKLEATVVTKPNRKMLAEDKTYNTAISSYTTITEQVLNMKYTIKLPYDIYSNGKPHTVTFAEQDIPVTYSYYTVPKLNSDAYLLAYITDYEKYNLLAGEANILFEGTYVGKTYLDPTSTKDTLELAMGVDKNVVISRQKVAEKSGKKILSSYRESSFNYDITVRNGKKKAINITVKDQYPLSMDKEVTVELTEKSGGKVDEEKAFITWDLKIEPQATKTIKLGYKVKYPKNKDIYNL